MELSDSEKTFLEKRRKLVQAWPFLGVGMLLLWAALTAWLIFTKPLLANPRAVLMQLKEDAIPPEMLMLMAGMLPVVVLLCLFLVAALILFMFAFSAQEKRYQALLQRAIAEQSGS